MRLLWELTALRQLEGVADRAPTQAQSVVNAMEWMAEVGFSLGRAVVDTDERYWPVPPLGVFYRVDANTLRVLRVVDARRLRAQP